CAVGERQLRRNSVIILHEHAGNNMRVVESWDLARPIQIGLNRRSGNPRMSLIGAADRCFAEPCAVPIVLDNGTELMTMRLDHRRSSKNNETFSHQKT